MILGPLIHDPVLGENVLPDTHAVYGGYIYVISSVDGTYQNAAWRNELSGRKHVPELKAHIAEQLGISVSEIRLCKVNLRPELEPYTK